MLVAKDGPHKEWLEEEEGGDMHAAYNYALAKTTAQTKPKEHGFEVRLLTPPHPPLTPCSLSPPCPFPPCPPPSPLSPFRLPPPLQLHP